MENYMKFGLVFVYIQSVNFCSPKKFKPLFRLNRISCFNEIRKICRVAYKVQKFSSIVYTLVAGPVSLQKFLSRKLFLISAFYYIKCTSTIRS